MALVVVSTVAGAGCDRAPEQRPRTVAELSAEELNKAADGLIDCSVPGLGVESPLAPVRTDVTGDGTPEVIASFECVTGDSSSFSHVVAYDGGSAADAPRVISTLVRMPGTATDYGEAIRTGAKVRKISVKGSVVTVVASKWRHEDAKACPALKYVQLFTVRQKALVAQEPTELDVAGCVAQYGDGGITWWEDNGVPPEARRGTRRRATGRPAHGGPPPVRARSGSGPRHRSRRTGSVC
ncbi:hypothetical protein [Streptomyces sp. SP18CS02]|uniref:hypothetical protein n=1 Tax=Streptomyces sp. SP18CS02 TaxID=3002531 RepID=UPI002E75B46D|nr:hypothetical protein [Streptomyces sp. SP18CS02]MEE1752208.1 hypothetical protein [Streptomyces sp. SP18CS02]